MTSNDKATAERNGEATARGENGTKVPFPIRNLDKLTDEQLWSVANGRSATFLGSIQKAIRHLARVAGAALNELKKRAKARGERWSDVLKTHFDGSPETARVYMRLARRWGDLKRFGLTQAVETLTGAKELLAWLGRLERHPRGAVSSSPDTIPAAPREEETAPAPEGVIRLEETDWPFLDESDFDGEPFRGDVIVQKPDGSLLFALRERRIGRPLASLTPQLLRRFFRTTNNRKTAAGGADELWSATVGCLKGEMMKSTVDEWEAFLRLYRFFLAPLDRLAATEFKDYRPATTWTVNRWDAEHNARMAPHPDGNEEGTLSAMTVLGSGFTGGLLVFPRYRVAVEVRSRDLLIFDGHEHHGNTPLSGTGTRLSVVAYRHA
jgi:hypothetical protein